jgi:predicted MFS family arabinose efflux permease
LNDVNDDSGSAKGSPRRLFLPALAVASFSSGPITVLAALLLVDIGNTFNTEVGVASQINTAYAIVAVIFALLTSLLSVKFKHKSLLLVGVLLMTASVLGCYFARDFISLLLFYSISGAGYAIVNPMTFALIGEHLRLEKRAGAIGWVVAGGALVYVVGAPIIAFMSGLGGWRFPLSAFVLPVLLVSLLIGFVGLPSASRNSDISAKTATSSNFKQIFLNKSALACLIGDTLRSAAFVAIVLYATSFFRQRFLLSTDNASLVLLGGATFYVFGSLSAGKFINRLGRKSSTALTALLSGIFTISYVFATNIWISMALMLVASWFFGIVASSANSLTLEQIPKHRGTMMSIDTALINAGSAIGSTTGGLALLYLNYEGLGSVLGAMGIAAAVVFLLLSRDPTTKPLK